MAVSLLSVPKIGTAGQTLFVYIGERGYLQKHSQFPYLYS